ncbi:MAG TPA: glycosyltransferase family 39 protein [Bryobacteraceae bacterium]|jgi:hypothetical protein|nr:glycosyltransferase family 39 protein [Bryobacteraceae bacterium]
MSAILNAIEDRKFWVPVCAAFLAAYLLAAVRFTLYPGYTDHVESLIASVSFLVSQGAPLYPDLAAAQRYSVPYGPMAYLPYALALRTLGASVLSLKLLILFAHLCLLILLWRCYRKLLDPSRALLATAAVCALLLSFLSLFQVRGDVLLLFFVVFGLHAVLRGSGWRSALLLAVACGFSLDIKFTAGFYFLPIYILFAHGRRWLSVLAIIGAGVFALTPFLLPHISLVEYLRWMHVFSREPLVREEVSRELTLLAILCAPLGLLLWQMAQASRKLTRNYLRENRLFLLSLVAGLAAISFAAAKIGAGPHHFIPFFPVIGYACADAYRTLNAIPVSRPELRRWNFLALLWCGLILAVVAKLGLSLLSASSALWRPRSQASAIVADLKSVMSLHPGKHIEMGYGSEASYPVTDFRPVLIFAGNPLTVDEMALDDMQMSGLAIPDATLAYVRACKTEIWLIPRDEAPFQIVNVYSREDPRLFPNWRVFDEHFRRIFLQHYRKTASTKYFDVWECVE